MDSETSFSVVIPARNAEKTLARAIVSVLAQTHRPNEIIVVDDASDDATAAIAHSYERHGVMVVALASQKGAAGARNAGIFNSSHPWVAFLDADDEWLPQKLQKQARIIRAHPRAPFAFCASHEFSPSGRYWGDTYQGRPVTDGIQAWRALLACNFVATPTVVARRDLLMELGGFDTRLKVAEDQDMWIRLALVGPPVYLPESLVRVHVRRESLSSWRLADQYAYTLPMIERHLANASTEGRLTHSEINAILGERLSRIGLVAAGHDALLRGVSMILRSALLGYRPLYNIGLITKLFAGSLYNRSPLRSLLSRSAQAKSKACVR